MLLAAAALAPTTATAQCGVERNLWAITIDGNGRSLTELRLDGSIVLSMPLPSSAGAMTGLVFDFADRLWASGDGPCGFVECLMEFGSYCSSSSFTASRFESPVGLNPNFVDDLALADDGRLMAADQENGEIYLMDSALLQQWSRMGPPHADELTAMAKFPCSPSDEFYGVADGNQLFRFRIGDNLLAQDRRCIATVSGLPDTCNDPNRAQGIQCMTAVPMANGNFLYAVRHDTSPIRLIKIDPLTSVIVGSWQLNGINEVTALAYPKRWLTRTGAGFGTTPNCADCDNDGRLDCVAIATGAVADCNDNGVPDACDIQVGTSPDCNGNGIPDECEVALAVSGVQPATAPAAQPTQVTVTGTGFAAGATVTFGGVTANSTQFVSSTQLLATTPVTSVGVVAVAVCNPGTATCPVGPCAPALPAAFTFCSAPPTLASLTPTNGSAPGTLVTLTGSGFRDPAQVWFGAIAVPAAWISDTTITANTPAQPPGAVDVAVENLDGTACASAMSNVLTGGFLYASAPTIGLVTPASGGRCGSTTVTITGAEFVGTPVVLFGATPALDVTVVDLQTIRAVSPPGALGPVDVTVDTGVVPAAVASGAFTYEVRTPVVSSITPPTGRFVGGETVTIHGADFCDSGPGLRTRVWLGDDEAAFVAFVDDTAIQVLTPLSSHIDGMPSFAVDVKVVNPDGEGSLLCDGFTFTAGNVLMVGGPANGHPFTSIQAAINAAVDGDAVLIDPDPRDASGPILFYNENLSIGGKKILVGSSAPGSNRRPRVLAQSGALPVIDIGSSATAATVVAWLEILGGRSGIRVTGGSPTLLHNEVHDNTAGAEGGGGVLIRNGASPLLRDNDIHINPPGSAAAIARGAGIAVVGTGCRPSLVDNFVHNNVAIRGGGLFVDAQSSLLRCEGNRFEDNVAEDTGGGIHFASQLARAVAPTTIVGGTIAQNVAGSDGGGVHCIDGTHLWLTGVEVRTNSSEGNGGGLALSTVGTASSSITLQDCLLYDNLAVGPCGRGGAIHLAGQASPALRTVIAQLQGCRIYENRAQVGAGLAIQDKVFLAAIRNEFAGNRSQLLFTTGDARCPWQPATAPAEVSGPGIYASDCELQLVNNTLHDNRGSNLPPGQNGGALYVRNGLISQSQVTNNVFTNNESPALSPAVGNKPVSYNDYFGNTAAGFAVPTEPPPAVARFVDPLFVGGLQSTLPADLASPTPFDLSPQSPMRDVGFTDASPSSLFQVPPGGGTAVDVGAREYGADMVTLFGRATPNHCSEPQIAIAGTPQLGTSLTVTGTGLVPGNFLCFLAIGSEASPPIDLAAIGGIAGSHSYVVPVVIQGMPVSLLGVGSSAMVVPMVSAFIDVRLVVQILELDAGLLATCNCALPMAHTRAMRWLIRP